MCLRAKNVVVLIFSKKTVLEYAAFAGQNMRSISKKLIPVLPTYHLMMILLAYFKSVKPIQNRHEGMLIVF
jgi:hypothetical protein